MQNKEWKGNKHSVFVTLGASNHSSDERQPDDYYATEPLATRLLLAEEKFNKKILEPACGEGHMSKELISAGYEVTSFDKVNRGYGDEEDFFCRDAWDGDIITNPPYKCALDFVQHALEIVPEGSKVAFFLKIQFLEGKVRRKFFNVNPPRKIFVASSRLLCAKNGDFQNYPSSALCYAWFVWEKGFKGDPIIKWIN